MKGSTIRLIMAIVAALVAFFNGEFGLHLTSVDVAGVVLPIIALILAEAHVDGANVNIGSTLTDLIDGLRNLLNDIAGQKAVVITPAPAATPATPAAAPAAAPAAQVTPETLAMMMALMQASKRMATPATPAPTTDPAGAPAPAATPVTPPTDTPTT